MAEVGDIQVYPLLAGVPTDDSVRIGVVSLAVVPPDHLSVSLTSVHPDPGSDWVLPLLSVSCNGGPRFQPLGGGGSGSDGWMRWSADFLGHVADPVELVEISFVDRASAAELASVSVTPRQTTRHGEDHRVTGDVDAVIAADHDLLLPASVAPVHSTIAGIDDHAVVSIEDWASSSVVLVFTPDEQRQAPFVPGIAVGRDEVGRIYDVRSEGGGTWCRGAASHLRITPRVPHDVDALDLAWGGSAFHAARLPVRPR